MNEAEKATDPNLIEVRQAPRPASIIGLSYRGRQRIEKVPPCVISTADLRRLYTDLEIRSAEALNAHLATLHRPDDVPEARFQEAQQEIRTKAQLAVTIHGADGDQIVQRSVDALSDDKLPGQPTLVYFDSAQAMLFIHRDHQPLNRFYVRLDFTGPPGVNTYNPWSQPTPNTSEFGVIGDNEMWVTGVHEFIRSFFKQRGRNRRWLHSNRFFNAAHWLVGFPAALWITARSAFYVPELKTLHPALSCAIYIYISLVALLAFRGILFSLRWLFPVIEIVGSRPRPAIRNAAVIGLGTLFLSLLYDVLKFAVLGR